MKKKTFQITVLVLLSALVLFSGTCCFALFRFADAAKSMAEEMGEAMKDQDSVEVSEEDGVMKFYKALFDQMNQYGNPQETGEKSAELVSAVFEKTLKYCTVKNIVYEANGISLEIEGVCVPNDQFSPGLLASAAGKAAISYVGGNLFSVGASLFQGQDAIKRLLYGGYANELLSQLTSDVEAMQPEATRYTLKVRMENGKWIIESADALPEQNQNASNGEGSQTESENQADSAQSNPSTENGR